LYVLVRAIDALADGGPGSGRPLVDTIIASRLRNLGQIMSGYMRWKDIRAEHTERAGGEEAVEAGKQELLAKVQVGFISRSTSTTATSLPSPEF
jgi:hypothetical protein